MRKHPLFLVGLLGLAGLLSACDAQFTSAAARVDGTGISTKTLNDAMNTIAADPGYRCIVASQSGGASIEGNGADTFSKDFASTELGVLVQAEIVRLQVLRLRITEGPAAQTVGAAQLAAQLSPSSSSPNCTTSGTTILNALSPSSRRIFVQNFADEDALAAHTLGLQLTDSGLRAYAATHRSTTTLACIEAVLVASQAKAQVALTQLQKGAPFADVARSLSIDTSSAQAGGSIGCVEPTQLTSPLNGVVAKLATGVTSAPVKFGPDYVILRVTSRKAAPLTDVAEAAIFPVLQLASFKNTLKTLFDRAEVEVNPVYGSWSPTTQQVTVVPGPANGLLINPGAVTPAKLPTPSPTQ